jgi:anti-sigma-K factor RskA
MNTVPKEDTPLPPGDDVRSGEYVLGVLDAGERREAQARIAAEPAFAREVEAWENRLAPWLLSADPVAPGAHVWPRIRTALGWPSVQGRGGLWNDTRFWRAATALATAASVAAIVFALRVPVEAPLPPVVVTPTEPVPPTGEEAAARPVTVLAQEDGATGWIATVNPVAGKVHMVPVPRPAEADGRVNELWVIPEGQAPISLGFVSNEMAHTIDVPVEIRAALAVGATLAVTLEPSEGIPHAAPSGPVVAAGGISEI